MNKRLLIIAGVLTAFVLVVMGGVFTSVLDQSTSGVAKLSDKVYRALGIKSEAQMQTSLLVNPNSENPVATNATERQPNAAVNGNSPNPVVVAANTPVAGKSAQWVQTSARDNGLAISTEQARSIAQRAAPNAQFGTPELVRYSGKVAYEVVSSQGNVYIDAATGAVLDNGAVAEAQPRGYREGDDDEENEHRGKKRKHHDEEDDDDEDRRG
jgi:hypothetical protein